MKISQAPLGTAFTGRDGSIRVLTGFDPKRGHMCMCVTQCWYVDDIEIDVLPFFRMPTEPGNITDEPTRNIQGSDGGPMPVERTCNNCLYGQSFDDGCAARGDCEGGEEDISQWQPKHPAAPVERVECDVCRRHAFPDERPGDPCSFCNMGGHYRRVKP